MKLVDAYIGKAIIAGTGMALLVLTSLDVFFALVGELDDVGKGDYGYADVFLLMVYTLPATIYELFPAAVLVGGLLSMGALASNSELLAMRAAGVSVKRIVGSAAQAGVLILLIAALIGEFVVPPASRFAQSVESKKKGVSLSQQLSGSGLWIRDDNLYISIGRIFPNLLLQDVRIYEVKDQMEIVSATHAATAYHRGEGWELRKVARSYLQGDVIEGETLEREMRPKLLDPQLFDVITVEPDSMSARELFRYVQYLVRNKLDPTTYQLAFWLKITTPLSCIVMLFLVLPFVFGSLRSVGAGQLLVVGILVGLGFYILIQIASRAGQIYGIPPFISATFPVLIFTFAGLVGLTRIR